MCENSLIPFSHIPIFAQFRVKGQADPLPPHGRPTQRYLN